MRGTLEELNEALTASMAEVRMTRDAAFEGVSTDSRTVQAGALFVALRGETFDAHDFLDQVAAKGVAAVVVEKLPENFPLPAIVVPDTLVALGMNHPGEIARLAAIAQPSVALVNNAQREHQEFMHTVEAVARENGSVLDALGTAGVAVFPAEDPCAPVWQSQAVGRATLTFALQGQADVMGRAQWVAPTDATVA